MKKLIYDTVLPTGGITLTICSSLIKLLQKRNDENVIRAFAYHFVKCIERRRKLGHYPLGEQMCSEDFNNYVNFLTAMIKDFEERPLTNPYNFSGILILDLEKSKQSKKLMRMYETNACYFESEIDWDKYENKFFKPLRVLGGQMCF